jgi:hypothetical protein
LKQLGEDNSSRSAIIFFTFPLFVQEAFCFLWSHNRGVLTPRENVDETCQMNRKGDEIRGESKYHSSPDVFVLSILISMGKGGMEKFRQVSRSFMKRKSFSRVVINRFHLALEFETSTN